MALSAAGFKERVSELLRSRNPSSGSGHLVPSAVLMPFIEKQGCIHLLFTRRTSHVARHKGQVSFPGGAKDPCDGSLLDTALRESAEEIGLDPCVVEVLGRLDAVPTVASEYVITPYVGFLRGAPILSLCRDEVDGIFDVPLDDLLKTGALHDECVEIEGVPHTVMAYRSGGNVIWGATARIVKQFADIVGPGLPESVCNGTSPMSGTGTGVA